MNTQSNTYTFLYASVMVIVVAAILAFTAFKLQPTQEKNVRIEKFQNILASIKVESTPQNAEELYSKYIIADFVVDANGNLKEGKGFDVNLKPEVDLIAKAIKIKADLAKSSNQALTDELEKIKTDRQLPLFECKTEEGEYIIIPIRGKGLWGPIWGYVSLEKDYNTIYGVVFAHKGETPGLGADIDKAWFQDPFAGKKIFADDGRFVGINVYKGGAGAAELAGDSNHGVDGISGGTITSKGLEAMVKDCLVDYAPYFTKQHEQLAPPAADVSAEGEETPVQIN